MLLREVLTHLHRKSQVEGLGVVLGEPERSLQVVRDEAVAGDEQLVPRDVVAVDAHHAADPAVGEGAQPRPDPATRRR